MWIKDQRLSNECGELQNPEAKWLLCELFANLIDRLIQEWKIDSINSFVRKILLEILFSINDQRLI